MIGHFNDAVKVLANAALFFGWEEMTVTNWTDEVTVSFSVPAKKSEGVMMWETKQRANEEWRGAQRVYAPVPVERALGWLDIAA